MALFSKMVAGLALFGASQPVAGNVFLAKVNHESAMMNETSVKARLLEEVSGFMGRGHVDLQLPAITKALEPMWLSLPKNSYGNLDSAQVRYALHRYFVQAHGWRIDGLERMGSDDQTLRKGSASNPAGLLRERVPAFLMDVFEDAFGKTGLKQHELSIFAATLEHIIHDETTGRLADVYEALALSRQSVISTDELDQATDAYMMSLLLGLNRLKTPGSMEMKLKRLQKAYPGWKDTQLFLRDVRHTVDHFGESSTNGFSAEHGYNFQQAGRVVTEVSNQFGGYQNMECSALKDTLLEAEERDSGRVLLSDFYKKGLETGSLFKESADYLRQQGALDETKPGEPRVIVTNFLQSPGNCLADTGLYSICCMNECEGLLSHLEREIAAPDASSERILEIVEGLESSTVEAPRRLPDRLQSQLELVAMRLGGKVPLHSRSLAQWLHVAYPRECPYPHTAASSSTKSTSELKASYATSKMNTEQREKYIESMQKGDESEETSSETSEEELLAQWSNEEEILYHSAEDRRSSRKFKTVLKVLAGVVAVGGVAAAVTDQLRRTRGGASLCEKSHLV